MSAYSPLSTIQPGDQLAQANMKLAYFLAAKYSRWAASRGIDPAAVESEALLALLLACREYDPACGVAVGACLGRSIKFAIFRLVKKKGNQWRHVPLPMNDKGEELPVEDHHGESPEGDAEFNDDRALLRRLLAVLRPREREILLLRHYEGLTPEEAGGRLGISKERVRQLEARAIARMRRHARQADAGSPASSAG